MELFTIPGKYLLQYLQCQEMRTCFQSFQRILLLYLLMRLYERDRLNTNQRQVLRQWQIFTKNQAGGRGTEFAECFRSSRIFVEHTCFYQKNASKRIEAQAKSGISFKKNV